jgi:hypothetical protein
MATQQKKQKYTTIVTPVVLSHSQSEIVPVFDVIEQTFENDLILQNILSFVGSHEYLFIASINHTFRIAYTTLYPNQITHFDGSTMKCLKFCYHRKLTSKQKHALLQSTARYGNGNIEGLRYLRTKNDYAMILDRETINIIVKNTYLNVLKWAHGIRANVNWTHVIETAAEHGNRILLEWLYTKHPLKFTATACEYAALGDQLHTLQWLLERDCTLNYNVCSNAAMNGHFKLLKWVRNNDCINAAKYNHLDILQWARTNGCPWDESVCSNAAMNGNLVMLQWARSKGCPWDIQTCTNATRNGHLGVLQWAYNHGCPWDKSICWLAAKKGYLDILQWARSHGCPWDELVCSDAARNRHFEILQWAHLNGCPWGACACIEAAVNDHFDILQWAHLHGCPLHVDVCTYAAKNNNLEMLQWARLNGCPWDEHMCSYAAFNNN